MVACLAVDQNGGGALDFAVVAIVVAAAVVAIAAVAVAAAVVVAFAAVAGAAVGAVVADNAAADFVAAVPADVATTIFADSYAVVGFAYMRDVVDGFFDDDLVVVAVSFDAADVAAVLEAVEYNRIAVDCQVAPVVAPVAVLYLPRSQIDY